MQINLQIVHAISWKKTSLKLTSQDILLYLWSVNLSKSFSQLIVSIFIFLNHRLIIFSQYSLDSKVRGYPTLLTSWFINFKLTQINLTQLNSCGPIYLISRLSKNVRKPEIFWSFQGVTDWILAWNGLMCQFSTKIQNRKT